MVCVPLLLLHFTERGFGVRGALGVSDRGNTAISQVTPGDIVMIGNEEDFTACLGLTVPDTDENLTDPSSTNFRKMIGLQLRGLQKMAR